jgi:hypothetical protein
MYPYYKCANCYTAEKAHCRAAHEQIVKFSTLFFYQPIKEKKIMNAAKVLDDLKRRFPNEPEYHQAVEEVLSTIEENTTNTRSLIK